jgi:hypothetical protein
MSVEAQMKVLELCKGMTLKQIERRFDILEAHIANKQLKLRIQTRGLVYDK